nr:NADH dehydrogenase subunit 6 [Procloeon bifidum]
MLHVLFLVIMWISLYFLRLVHPISMGVMLILHTFVVGVVTGLLADNFIYSYILFLVVLGGVLVLFIYMTSLVSNEVFTLTWVDILMFISILFLSIIALIGLLTPASTGLMIMENFNSLTGVLTELKGMSKLYSDQSYLLTLFLVVYLLFVLLVCVSVVGNKSGALRKFN